MDIFDFQCISNNSRSLMKGNLSDYFENELQQQFMNLQRSSIAKELMTFFVHFHKLLRWHDIPKTDMSNIKNKIPCGAVHITSIPITKYKEWIIVVHEGYGINISFVKFEMDYSSDACIYTLLTIYQEIKQTWCHEGTYCGRRLPFQKQLISSKSFFSILML